jgi:hypothetical protein
VLIRLKYVLSVNLWVKHYNSAEDITPTLYGGYIITGDSVNDSFDDILLIKIDSMGNEEWGYYHHPSFQILQNKQ